MVWNIIKEIISILWIIISESFKMILDVLLTFVKSDMILSKFDFVKYIIEQEILNNFGDFFGKIITYAAPLLVILVLSLVGKKISLGKGDEINFKIILYIIAIYLLSSGIMFIFF